MSQVELFYSTVKHPEELISMFVALDCNYLVKTHAGLTPGLYYNFINRYYLIDELKHEVPTELGSSPICNLCKNQLDCLGGDINRKKLELLERI